MNDPDGPFLMVLRSYDGSEQTRIRLGNLTAGSNTLHGHSGAVSVSVEQVSVSATATLSRRTNSSATTAQCIVLAVP
jgi:hypothetical protein